MISRKHPPSVGGMQQLSLHLVTGLSARQPVTAITWGGSARGLPLFLAWAQLRLAWGLLLGRVDLLHLGDPALALLGWLPRLAGVPVFATVHGLDITHPSPWYQAYLSRFFWGRMAAYACISRHVQSLVLARDVAPELAPVIVPGVQLDRPYSDQGGRFDGGQAGIRLLCLGRLVERKGVAWFLESVAPGWFERHPDAGLDVVGDGPLRARIEALAADVRLRGRVHLHGEVDEASKRALLARADLVLVPNVHVPGDAEGFGIVCLEAGANAAWVLAADIEGLRDAIVEGANGQRVAAGDAAAWTATLDALCADRAQLSALGEQAREAVHRLFGWPVAIDRYERLIASLAHGR
jgi:phosphatidylinositol alpha-1,6-mannosyltransferase